MLKKKQKSTEELQEEVNNLKELRQLNESDADPEDIEAAHILANDDAPEKEHDWAKRYSDTKSHMNKKFKEYEDQLKAKEEKIEQLLASDPKNIPQTEEELQLWKQENPEIATAIERIARDMAENQQKPLKEEIDTLKTKEKETTKELVKKKVVDAHADFDELAADPKFHEWVEEQDQWVSEALYQGLNARNAIQAINLYKLENNLLSNEDSNKKRGRPRKEEADAARLVAKNTSETPTDSTNKGYIKESTITSWTLEQFEKNKDIYLKAKAEGKILYGQ